MEDILWPKKMKIGGRIHNKEVSESIYGIEYGAENEKYISTIDIFDRGFKILRTYKVKESEIELIKKVERPALKNIEKATLDDIENDIGLKDLSSQLN